MIDGRTQFVARLAVAVLAYLFGPETDALSNKRRNRLIVIFSDPFINVSHNRISARLFAFSPDHSTDFIFMYSI